MRARITDGGASLLQQQRLRCRGFALIEVLIAGVLLVLALVGFTGAIGTSLRTNAANRERVVASEGARQVLEILTSTDFREIFVRFNDDPSDDPEDGKSPGSAFELFGLVPQAGDPDGMVGEVIFPNHGDPGELREDVEDLALDMPRDLDMDGDVDSEDHSEDYKILPVRIRVRWTGKVGLTS